MINFAERGTWTGGPMADSCFTEIGGLRTHYLRAGTGPALFLLHGQLPGSSAVVEFGPAVDHFAAAGYSVWAPDLAGFGETDNPGDFSIEARIAHARGFIASTGAGSYAIWGSSMGTYIGARIALDDPRVERLIIMPSNVLPPPAPGPRSEAGERVGKIIHDYVPSLENARVLLSVVIANAAPSGALVERFYAMSTGKNEAAERGRRAAPRPQPIHSDLQRLAVPSLLLWGADDPGATPERALLLLAAMPAAELHVLKRCGHWPQHDQPQRTYQLTKDFLGRNG
jgi:2-hydroxy-6-oxonona-2,4-dienedioate hydrolase